MTTHRLSLLAGLAGTLLIGASTFPAHATSLCHLRKTADGFVALRSEPSAQSKLVGRMRAQDEVLIGEGEKGQWVEVTWWRGEERVTKGFETHSGKGWVNRKLIADDCG